MIDINLLCQKQRKKIFLFFSLIVIAVFASIFVNTTIVARNVYLKAQIYDKKETINLKREKFTKIDQAIKRIRNKGDKNITSRKQGYYDDFDKSQFISSVSTKIRGEDDLDFIDENKKSGVNNEYSDFSIVLNAFGENDLTHLVWNEILAIKQTDRQDIDITLDANVLKISFKADYEYVAYKMLSLLKRVLPGYVIVKKFSVKPVLEETKHFLYNMKFKHSSSEPSLDNRLLCEIEILWVFLKSLNTKKFIEESGN